MAVACRDDAKHAFQTEPSSDVDVAHGALEDLHNDGFDTASDKSLLRKIDWRLMPLICITYILQSIDKTTLGYAAVFGLKDDTHLVGSQYSWLGALFYLGYLAFEYPTGILLQKLPIARFMSGTVILWGVVLMCHAAATDFAGLAAARTFLGVFEASINPGTMLIFSMWYRRIEQPLRLGIWVGSAGIGYVTAGIASFGIDHIGGSLVSWRYIFIIWGAITGAWGFFAEALLDPKTWLLFVFAVTSNAPNGGLTNFQSLIIKGMGFSTLQTTLIQMPSGAVQFIVCTGATYFASTFPNSRLAIMLICLVPFLAGTIGTWLVPQSVPYGRLVCLWISFSYTATWTLSMSVATANTAGHTKKVTTNATLLVGYCLGNFIGPFFFLTSQAPRYELGVGMMFFCIGIQVLSICGIWALLWIRNRKRRHAQVDSTAGYQLGLEDVTDRKNPHFEYVY
ncbi:major facilitator superfamily transporter [Lecanosticta acicola]|uniref:Major facilitator superfamily transporter n=1 Tax=Lecanosticta acicola TaxID=111012 RepID=A0AAI9EEK5_9PEZI|nr:major facilitator superfamily transporter [Lecanosticta acicola]